MCCQNKLRGDKKMEIESESGKIVLVRIEEGTSKLFIQKAIHISITGIGSWKR